MILTVLKNTTQFLSIIHIGSEERGRDRERHTEGEGGLDLALIRFGF